MPSTPRSRPVWNTASTFRSGRDSRIWAPVDGPPHLRPIDSGANLANSVAIRIQYALTYTPGNLTIADGALAGTYNQIQLVDPNAL